jgi:hypothetical protein
MQLRKLLIPCTYLVIRQNPHSTLGDTTSLVACSQNRSCNYPQISSQSSKSQAHCVENQDSACTVGDVTRVQVLQDLNTAWPIASLANIRAAKASEISEAIFFGFLTLAMGQERMVESLSASPSRKLHSDER